MGIYLEEKEEKNYQAFMDEYDSTEEDLIISYF